MTQAHFETGSVTNIPSEHGTGGGQTVSASDNDTVTLQQNPSMTLEKTHQAIVDANHDSKQDAGDTVIYDYKVTNTGNVTLTNLSVTDDNGTAVTTDDFKIRRAAWRESG